MVECLLPKQNVAGSSPVSRSNLKEVPVTSFFIREMRARTPLFAGCASEQRLKSSAKVFDLKHNSKLPFHAS